MGIRLSFLKPNSHTYCIFLERNPVSSIAERIKQFNSNRLPTYAALKYQQMAENPFRFFRGTCHLFYEDLHSSNALPAYPISWVCGDLHLENFGTYKGDNRLVYFDLNDFDEGILAPVTWEVARMVSSIFTGFEALGIKKKEATRTAALFLRVFSTTLANGKAKYLESQTANGIVRLFLEKVMERKQKELIRQRTVEGKNGNLQFKIDRVRLFPLDKALRKQLMTHLGQHLQMRPLTKDRFQDRFYKHKDETHYSTICDIIKSFQELNNCRFPTARRTFVNRLCHKSRHIITDVDIPTRATRWPYWQIERGNDK